MIKPKVGRVVLFHPQLHGNPGERERTLPAIVCYVHSDRRVNLAVFDENGVAFAETSVPLVQPEDGVPADSNWCEWMKYQKQVAAGEIPPVLHA